MTLQIFKLIWTHTSAKVATPTNLIYCMFTKRLLVLLFCLIKGLEASAPFSDLNDSVNEKTVKVPITSLSSLDERLSHMTLKDKALEEQKDATKSSLSPFKISEQVGEIINAISDCDTMTAVKMIEAGLGQIIDSGVYLHDIAPTIGSLPIEAKELVLAAIENKAYTLLRLLQKAYIWHDEHQYHWFMALSYGSPWYEKETWENLTSFPLNWKNNLRAICEADNGSLVAKLRNDIPLGGALESFDEELSLLCIEYDAIKIFESAGLNPTRLKEHLELLAKNSAARLLQLYQIHTNISHLHLEEFPFPSKLPADVEGFKFLMKNGYNYFSMVKFIKKFCKEGRLDLLKYLQELDPKLVPNSWNLKYAAARNFVDILDWDRLSQPKSSHAHDLIYKKLVTNRHFDTFLWWVKVNEVPATQDMILMATKFGALKVLQWIDREKSLGENLEEVADLAVENRHFSILEWLYERYKVLPTIKNLEEATDEILDWIRSKSETPKDPLVAIRLGDSEIKYKDLVERGACNLKLLQWVFKNAPLSVFDTKRENLSKNIKSKKRMVWLYENLQICPSDMDWAYWTGDLEAIKWAVENCKIYPTGLYAETAVGRGHFHIIAWIHETLGPERSSCLDITTLQAAICNGNLEIAEYLISSIFPEKKGSVSISEDIGVEKHLTTLKWAHERGFSINQPEQQLLRAIKNGDIQSLEWLSDHFPVSKLDLEKMWWEILVMSDLYKSYKWLLEKYPEMHQSEELAKDIQTAYLHGSLGILKVLYEKDPSLLLPLLEKDAARTTFHIHQWFATNIHPVTSKSD